MSSFIKNLDDLTAIDPEPRVAAWLDRIAFGFLCLMVIAAPHSIAATQTAWLAGMLFFFARRFFKPRINLAAGGLGIALIALFAWTVLSSVLSYAPDISMNKLRGAGLFLIFFFVVGTVRSFRAVCFLVFLLIASCLVNVLLMPLQRVVGRGVEIQSLQPDGILSRSGFQPGDVLLEINGNKVSSPSDVSRELSGRAKAIIKYQNLEFYYERPVDLYEYAEPDAGITKWTRSRNWRSAGFYSHFTTYAEVLQLVASLVFGLFVAAFLAKNKEFRFSTFTRAPATLRTSPFRFLYTGIFAAFCLAAFSVALLLTVTRGPQLAFLISCFCILLIGASRRWLIIALLIAIPVAAAGLFILQHSRNVGFIDANDAGQNWRLIMYRDGISLWTNNPRNFIFGVGMNSIERYACEWGLYDNCRSEFRSHFHSTPIQLVVERGLPALILWLTVLAIYARSLWRAYRNTDENDKQWGEGSILPDHSPVVNRGIWLGALGGLVGFFSSSLVHYNYGDAEVAMVFYLIMGLATKLSLLSRQQRT